MSVDIQIRCACGQLLKVEELDRLSDTTISFTIEKCKPCPKENYDAGVKDAE